MQASNRKRSAVKLLLLSSLAAGLGAGPTRDDALAAPQEQAPYLSAEEARTYQGGLQGLLASPCDAFAAPANNEIHDCQRLVTRGASGPEFGSLMGIFPNLQVVGRPEGIYGTPQVSAYITNAGGFLETGDSYRDSGAPRLGIPARAAGSASPDIHCLWLWNPRGGEWSAAITPARDLAQCREPTERDWLLLQVTRQTYANLPAPFYPPTARWQWTTPGRLDSGEHYIGVECGAWCAITPTGVAPPPLPAPPPPGSPRPPTATARRAIPGWSDAQFLAVGTRGRLRPGPWGEVYSALSPQPPGTPAPPDYERAAWVTLRGDVGDYEHKLGLMDIGGDTWSSWVELLHQGPNTPPLAQYRGMDGGVVPSMGVRTASNGHGTHGSARWRWQVEDETIWLPCYEFGCCDVEGGG